MKDRLEKFLKTEGLTPARFAEIMGVQPSSISHIISGRNNPRFDFIEKILLRFPKINPDWLILGKGQIYRTLESDAQNKSNFTTSSPVKNTIPDSSLFDTFQKPAIDMQSADPETEPKSGNIETFTNHDDVFLTSPESHKTDRHYTNNISSNSKEDSNSAKIDHIVVFYSDKTFTSYRPK